MTDAPHFISAFFPFWIEQLYREFEHIIWERKLCIPKPVIRIEFFKSTCGQWDPLCQTLTLSAELIEKHPWGVVKEVLKHEMAHMLSDDGHGPQFQRACQHLGVRDPFCRAYVDIPADVFSLEQTQENPLVRKVQRLLSLAGSENEHEAALAMAKVKELMDAHRISTFATQGVQHPFCVHTLRLMKKRLPRFYLSLSHVLVNYFHVEAVWSREYHAQRNETFQTLELLGERSHVLMAEHVFYFMVHTLEVLWEGYKKTRGALPRHKTAYELGVIKGFEKKLSVSVVRAAAQNPIESTAIVNHQKVLSSFVEQYFPRVTVKKRGASLRIDENHYNSGMKDGKNVTIRPPVEERKKAILMLR